MPHVHDVTPDFQFCPRCGGPLQAKCLKAGEPHRLVCAGCRFVFYLDPKVAVGTIIRHDSGIVLVQRAIDPGYGKWVFPGGYVDRGEALEEAAVREAREECGLSVKLEGLLNVYSYAGRPAIIVVYAATSTSGELSADDECLAARVFEPAAIPWEELAFRSTREALQDYVSQRFSRAAQQMPESTQRPRLEISTTED